MSRCRVGRGVVLTLAVAAIIASCGGSDGGGENDVAPATSAAESTETTDAAEPTDDDADTAPDESEESSDSSSGGDTTNCDAIFSMAEIEEFFGEPAELTEETDDSLGRLLCNWESIEDPDDLDDLAFTVLTVQLYSGDPIDASAFVDPSIFETVTTIDGIGDLAFSTDELGLTFAFVDDPLSGVLTYTEADMGDTDAPDLRTADDVEQLFRTFHERVT